MYRPIVSTAMRQQISSSIIAPRFCNMKLNSFDYTLSISFQITEEMHLKIQSGIYGRALKSFRYNGRYLIHWEKTYQYSIPFYSAFNEAYEVKKHLKIIMRKVKQAVLEDEIDLIKYCE